MDNKFESIVRNPGSEYRGKPFWAWNGKLEPEELRRQIRLMKDMGLGGFFMHSRVGLDTEYLSEEWFRNVDACIDEAEKQDMEAWLYDEDRWPSGAAGGLVTKNIKYRMRRLTVREYTDTKKFKWEADTLAVFHIALNDSKAKIISRIKKGSKLPAVLNGELIIAFVKTIEKEKDWYNGATYLDTMNPEAVKEFIKVTHERYKKRYGKKFSKSIPGIFTDEPHHGGMMDLDSDNNPTLVWTDKLPEVFKKRYGYDILDHLVEIVYDIAGEESKKARHDYHDCKTYMFINSFAKQVGEWCKKNNIKFTGHVLEEDKPSKQTRIVGNAMRFYEYMQAPGIDLLTERWRVYDTAKQCSSVARQFGAKWRLTETYGCTGWDFSFAGHKALGDWQSALGINLRCQHLSWYTMLGEAKRDYPASIFYQSPWWDSYKKVEDYFARIGAVMTKGEEIRDLLVIHPVESAWLTCRKGWEKAEDTIFIDNSLVELRDTLLTAHLDFDYGDEEIMSRHAKVAKGKDGAILTINKGKYRAVVVPPMYTIRKSTLKLLTAFKAAGGKVIFAGKVPTLVDGVKSDAAQKLAESAIITEASGSTLAAASESTRRIKIADAEGNEIVSVIYLLREDKEQYYLFVCNTSNSKKQMYSDTMQEDRVCDRREEFKNVIISGFADCAGSPIEVNVENGKFYAAEAAKVSGVWNINTSLPVIGSRTFIIPKKKETKSFSKQPVYKTVRSIPLNENNWQVRLSECNNLVLDRSAFKIGKTEYKAEDILKIDKEVRKALGLSSRGGSMMQPWAKEKVDNPKSVPVELTYSFNAEYVPDGDIYLAVECPEKFDISVNGTCLNTDMRSGWWVDRSLEKIPIDPSLIRRGENSIVMTIDYDQNYSGLEIVYLLGRFGTTVDGLKLSLTEPVSSLKIGDWCNQGLAFYSGSVSYITSAVKPNDKERVYLAVPEYNGVALKIHVNGKSAGIIAWQPDEADITDYMHEGKNEILIEVLGHRRNSHGPHHHQEKWPRWTGPAQYQSTELWFEGYNLVPCGLNKNPELFIKKEM
ncbi:MAG: hypothetical protein JNL74_19345 [Fibrobacteres bacterium]|nr:hypothetical protein [Fibrobacterota bacterium]